MIKVELLDSCGNDNVVANAARVSFADFSSWSQLPDGYSEQRRDKLLHYLADHEHTSPFRHTSITIRCSAPVFLARQLMKHQAGLSWNEESRRYIDTEPEFFVPDVWRSRPEGSLKQGSGDKPITSMQNSSGRDVSPHDQYKILIRTTHALYRRMLEAGVAPEMARMALPQSMMVNWVWTGNLLAFAHVYRLRSGHGAQEEAKVFASQLGKILYELFPVSSKELLGELNEPS